MIKNEKGMVEIKIKIDPAIADGHYINWSLITHNPAEFVIDFCKIMPGQLEHNVKTRVIMSPLAFKSLLIACQANLSKYEEKFGEVMGIDEFSKVIVDPINTDKALPN